MCKRADGRSGHPTAPTAFKFTFEGEVAISLKLVNGAVEWQVRDTGVGILIREHVGVRHHRALRMPDLPRHETKPGRTSKAVG